MSHLKLTIASAVLTALTITTGCASKSGGVVVAPNAPTGYTGPVYNANAPLVANSDAIKAAAANCQVWCILILILMSSSQKPLPS